MRQHKNHGTATAAGAEIVIRMAQGFTSAAHQQ